MTEIFNSVKEIEFIKERLERLEKLNYELEQKIGYLERRLEELECKGKPYGSVTRYKTQGFL